MSDCMICSDQVVDLHSALLETLNGRILREDSITSLFQDFDRKYRTRLRSMTTVTFEDDVSKSLTISKNPVISGDITLGTGSRIISRHNLCDRSVAAEVCSIIMDPIVVMPNRVDKDLTSAFFRGVTPIDEISLCDVTFERIFCVPAGEIGFFCYSDDLSECIDISFREGTVEISSEESDEDPVSVLSMYELEEYINKRKRRS